MALPRLTGPLRVQDSATLMCVRRNPRGALKRSLRLADLRGGPESVSSGLDSLIFGGSEVVTFTSDWQVLMGQREVVNYVESTEKNLRLMRYPGEFTLPGGVLDAGEAPEAAARRELREELGLAVTEDARLRLITVNQTRPVHNKSNVIFNYVAHEEENPWLRSFSAEACNEELRSRRAEFSCLLRSGEFWRLARQEREAFSPEVVQVRWLDVAEFVEMAYRPHTNAYQAAEFRRLGIHSRHPIFMTVWFLMELETFPSLRSLARATEGMDVAAARQKAIYLEDGWSPEQVSAAMARRGREEAIDGWFLRTRAERHAAAAEDEEEEEGGRGEAPPSARL